MNEKAPYAEIIAIGTELVIGQIQDTNSYYLASALDALGFKVRSIHVIADERNAMLTSIQTATARSTVTIITGGLGPTDDDFTKSVLLEHFGGHLIENAPALDNVKRRLEARGLPLTERNREQALVPSTCEVLPNALGTAPGMLFNVNGHILVSLPGVPFEMKCLFEQQVQPRIAALAGKPRFHRTVKMYGIAESILADRIALWEKGIQPVFSLAYLPSPEYLRLRLSAKENYTPEIATKATEHLKKLQQIIPDELFGEGDTTLATAVGDILCQCGQTIATAESCTGGGVGNAIITRSGASAYFRGGITAYCNEAKQALLGVKATTLQQHTPVSEPTAIEMAQGARAAFGSDYAIATTGYIEKANAQGATENGEVWIACVGPNRTNTQHHALTSTREVNLRNAINRALNLLRLTLLQDYPQAAYKIETPPHKA